MLSIKLDLSKRTLLLILTLGCLFSCTEEPDPLPPEPILNITDTSGAWSWSGLPIGGLTATMTRYEDKYSMTILFYFDHQTADKGSFRIYYEDNKLSNIGSDFSFNSNVITTIDTAWSALSHDSSFYGWFNNQPVHQSLEITKVTEFEGQEYIAGKLYSYACNTDSRPICQTVKGTFENIKLRYYIHED